MADAMKLIALADDVTIVRSLEQLHSLLSKASMQPIDEIESQVVASADSNPAVCDLLALIREGSDRSLSPMDSVLAARWLLAMLAEREESNALVAYCIENEPEERLKVGTVLTVGLVGAIWICAATIDFSYADGKLEVHKAALKPEQIQLSAEFLKGKVKMAMSGNNQAKSSTAMAARKKKK